MVSWHELRNAGGETVQTDPKAGAAEDLNFSACATCLSWPCRPICHSTRGNTSLAEEWIKRAVQAIWDPCVLERLMTGDDCAQKVSKAMVEGRPRNHTNTYAETLAK